MIELDYNLEEDNEACFHYILQSVVFLIVSSVVYQDVRGSIDMSILVAFELKSKL